MPIAKDSLSTNAVGGTELMKNGLYARLPEGALDEFQLFVSRVEEPLDETKIRVLWIHDLPGDPANDHLKNGGWKNFHKIVFVSNWQMQAFISFYQLPWSHCIVLQNAIEPIDKPEPWYHGSPVNKPPRKIKLIYTPTPHRGLNILVPVFDKLCERYDNLVLDVYSSFKLYGWPQRDVEWEALYQQCKDHPKINYHGTVSNDEVREALQEAHIFAYPSTWPETSCLSLMEAMSASCLCVHSNYAGLSETAANWTSMYHYSEDLQEHARIFFTVLANSIEELNEGKDLTKLKSQKSYADIFYSWSGRIMQWQALLNVLLSSIKQRELPKAEFVYKI